MGHAFDGALSPTSHYYEIRGRAAEIARALGSPAGGAEHLFLGMLHDGGWPISAISGLVDLGRAEAAVLGMVNDADYQPPRPPPPHFFAGGGYVQTWGADVAFQMGDAHLGVEHAFLAMIRRPETIPARALAGLADLAVLEAAVLEAMSASAGDPPETAVFLPEGQAMDKPLRRAIIAALPEGTTFAFNSAGDERTWMQVIGPGDSRDPVLTREVLNTALARLNRPTTGS
jgi:hypothetical protein